VSRLRANDGFTVIELAVAAAISLVILSLSMTVMISMWSQAKRTESHNNAAQLARQGTDRLARQLRNLASPGDVITASTSAQPKSVDRNLPYDLVFKDVDDGALTSPTLNPANVRRVRYCLQTAGSVPLTNGGTASPERGVLWMQTQKTSATLTTLPVNPPADLSCPGSGWNTTQLVGDFVHNRATTPERPVFRYSDSNGEITATTAADRERIIRVESDLYIDPEPLKKPEETKLQTSVILRNQNRAPTAAFVLTKLSGCTVQLNGSGSEDPENKRLTYKWSVDGVALPANQQDRVVVQTTVTPGLHVFKLEVFDPAGLPATPATQSTTVC